MIRRAAHLPDLGFQLGVGVPLSLVIGVTSIGLIAPGTPHISAWGLAVGILGGFLPMIGGLLAWGLLRRSPWLAPRATRPMKRGWLAYFGLFSLLELAGYIAYEALLRQHFVFPSDLVTKLTWYAVTPLNGLAVFVWLENEAAYRHANGLERARLAEKVRRLFVSREMLALAASRRMRDAVSGQAERIAPRLQALMNSLEAAVREEAAIDVPAAREDLLAIAEEYRRLSHTLHPSAADIGLVPALHSLARQHDASVSVAPEADPGVLSSAEVLTAYRVVEAALDNVSRHAGARHVALTLTAPTPGALALAVQDDGVGFDADARAWGLGLVALDSRVALAGWDWSLVTAPGAGTRLEIRIQPTRSGSK